MESSTLTDMYQRASVTLPQLTRKGSPANWESIVQKRLGLTIRDRVQLSVCPSVQSDVIHRSQIVGIKYSRWNRRKGVAKYVGEKREKRLTRR